MSMKAVILAAGEGTRLEPLTNVRPKPMIPVANRPLLEHVIEAVAEAGIDDIVLVVGYKRERIQSHFGDGDDWDVNIEYAAQEKQLGTGHAVLQAEEFVDGEFIALNGDRVIDPDAIRQLIEVHSDSDEPVMAVTRSASPSNYGVVELDGQYVENILEKPPEHAIPTDVINAGVYGFGEHIFDAIRSTDQEGEVALTTTLQRLAEDGSVRAVRFRGLWLDLSYLWDVLSVNTRLLDRGENRTAETASIDDTASVGETTDLAADVRVHPNATVLRGSSLGPNVEVAANAVVENAVVLSDATIGAGAVVRDCVVGENAAVGANTTVGGGHADVVVDGEVHDDVRLGAVIGDNADVESAVTFESGTILGNESEVASGAVLDGRIESGSIVKRG